MTGKYSSVGLPGLSFFRRVRRLLFAGVKMFCLQFGLEPTHFHADRINKIYNKVPYFE